MKNNSTQFINLALLTCCLIFSGCDKFLNVNPPYTQDAENYFQSPEDYEQALVGAYDLLQGSFMSVWISEIASNNTIAGGESVNDTQGLHQIDEMTHGGVNSELRSLFRWNYAGITRCNFIMENKDNIEFSGKDKIIAEAKFLRAFYYFELVKFFGDVPLIIDERIGAQEATEIARSPVSEVYAQIEQDLLDASSALDQVSLVKGKATKGAAMALLGKVFLYQKKYIEAANKLDEVINSGVYSLISDYADLFSVANENNSETVFDVEYSGAEGGGTAALFV